MRPSRLLLLVAAAAVLGCGDRRLVLKVDVLSYLDPSLTQVAFGPVPASPGGFYSGEQEVVKDVEVNLVEGMRNVAEVQSVSLTVSTIAADSTGTGADTLRLYLSDPSVDPMTTPPAALIPISLTPGVTDTVVAELGTDSRVADLFAGKRVRLTLTHAMRGPDSGEDLNARLRVQAIDAVLIAGRRNRI